MAKSKGRGGTSPSVDQLKLAEAMYTMMDKMASRAEKIADSFQTQAQATAQMAENMKSMGTGEVVNQLMQVNDTLKQVVDSLKNLGQSTVVIFEDISEGALEASESTQQLNDSINDIGDAATGAKAPLNDLNKGFKDNLKSAKSLKEVFSSIGDYLSEKHPGAVGAALGAMSGLAQSFTNLFNIGSGLLSFLGSLASSLMSLGTSILMAPIRMLNALTETANSASGGVSELTEAINSLRKSFGALSGPTNSAIMTLSKSMESLRIGTLSSTLAFGNQADKIKLMEGLFNEGGAAIRTFTNEIVKGNGAVLVYQKGLGLSNEEMGSLANFSKIRGQGITKTLNNITKYADHMGKAFGLDAKIISKGMAKAAADTANFGHMSEKQLAVAVAYAEKLGLSIDKMVGTLDSMATFEDAADAVSMLNSTMNTNIDLNDVLQAQSDMEIFEVFKKGFAEAGISMDKMDFRTRKLIKSTTHFTDEQLNAMLAADNQNKTLKDMQKEGDKAEKKQMSQAEAFSKLADAIDRVYKSGGDRPKTFWEAFTSGIEKGIFRTKEMQKLMQNLRLATDKITQAGIKLGQMFVDKFPGVKKILGGIADLFDPATFGPMIDRFTKYFEEFFEDFDIGKLFSKMADDLKNQFGGEGGNKILEGIEEFGNGVVKIFTNMVNWVTDSLSGLFTSISDSLTDSLKQMDAEDAAKEAGVELAKSPEVASPTTGMFGPLLDAFKRMGKELGPKLGDILSMAFTIALRKLGKFLDDVLGEATKDVWWFPTIGWRGALAIYFFGPAVLQAILGALTGKLLPAIFKAIFSGGKDTAKALEKAGDAVSKGAESGGEKITSSFEKINKGIKGFFDTLKNVVKQIGEFLQTTIQSIVDVAKKLVDGIVEIGGKILEGLQTLIGKLDGVLQTALQVVNNFFTKALDILNRVGQQFVNTFFNIADRVVQRLNQLVTQLRPLVQNFLGLIGDALKEAARIIVDVGNIIADGVMKIVNTIMQGLEQASASLPAIAGNIGQAFGAFLQGLGTGLVAFGEMMATPTPLGVPVGLIIVGLALGLALAARLAAPAIEALGPMFTGLGEMFKGLAPLIEKAGIAIKTVLEGIGTVIKSVGESIGTVIKSMAESIKMLGEVNPLKLIGVAGGITAIAGALAAFGGGSVAGAIGGAVTKFIDEPPIDKIKAFESVDVDKLYKVADGLKAIAVAIMAFEGAGNALENVKKAVDATEGNTGVFGGLKEGWEKAKDALSKGNILEAGKNIVGGLTDGISEVGPVLKDAASEALNSFTDFLGISSPSKAFKEVGENIVDGLEEGLKELPDRLVELFEDSMKSVSDNIEKFIQSIPEKIGPAIEELQTILSDSFDADVFNKMFSKIKDALADVTKELADSGPFNTPGFSEKFFRIPAEAGKILGTNIKNLFSAGFDIMGAFQQGGMNNFSAINVEVTKNMEGLASFFENLAKAIQPITLAQQQIVSSLEGLGQIDPTDVKKKIDSVFEFVNSFISNPSIQVMKDNLQTVKVIQDIIGAGIVPSVKAVEDMMKAAKQIEESLNLGVQINLDAKLKTFADKFGKIGSKGAYTVQARDVNIHVKFNVTMDAAPIERIMISNASSLIRNRINLLIDATGEDDNAATAKRKLQQPNGDIESGALV